jgi:hypothetical protein
MKLEVTAVGRLLKQKGDEPRIYKVIAVKADGQVRTIVNKEMT